jgi:hypothetical protein
MPNAFVLLNTESGMEENIMRSKKFGRGLRSFSSLWRL